MLKELEISNKIEEYVQSLVIWKTFDSISQDHGSEGEMTENRILEIKQSVEVASNNEEVINPKLKTDHLVNPSINKILLIYPIDERQHFNL